MLIRSLHLASMAWECAANQGRKGKAEKTKQRRKRCTVCSGGKGVQPSPIDSQPHTPTARTVLVRMTVACGIYHSTSGSKNF